jgi:uncharacterized protein YbaP (TraB family)
MKIFAVLFLILAAALPCNPAAAQDQQAKSLEKKSADAAAKSGVVFKVQGKDAQQAHYLCGSIHLLRRDDYPLAEGYDAAYAAAKRLIFEIPPKEMKDPASAAKMLKAAMLAEGTLKDTVAKETYAALEKWAGANDVPILMFARMKPWMAGLTIALTMYSKQGMHPELGLDEHFAKKAEKDGKAQAGLESVEFQVSLFDSFESALQEKMILQAIEESADGEKKVENMRRTWSEGDTEGLAKEMQESFEEFPEVRKALLDDRNSNWIEKLEKEFRGDAPVMVIVGAGHLCGKGSVVELLAKRGWKVEQVKAATSPAPKTEPKP